MASIKVINPSWNGTDPETKWITVPIGAAVVDNLNDGGSLKALSAEQGKVLNEKFNEYVLKGDENILQEIKLDVNPEIGENLTATVSQDVADKLSAIKTNEFFRVRTITGGISLYCIRREGSGEFQCMYYDAGNVNTVHVLFQFNIEGTTLTYTYNTKFLADKNNVLAKDNTTEYTPTGNYHPATKKYIDDKEFNISSLITELKKYSTQSDITDFINTTYSNWNNLDNRLKTNICYFRTESKSNIPISCVPITDDTKDGIRLYMIYAGLGDNKDYAYNEYYEVYLSKTDSKIYGYRIGSSYLANSFNVLSKNNTTEFIPTSDYNPATKKYVDDNKFSGSYTDLTNKPSIPSKTSQLTNDSGFVLDTDSRLTNSRPASDVSAWAKAPSKPTYVWTEIGDKPVLATVATSGSYNDLSNKPTIPAAYTLPASTASALGGIKVGYTTSGKNYKVQLDGSNNAYVNVPWTDTNTTYNPATTSANGLMSSSDKSKLDGIATGANNYSHPTTSGNKHIPSGGSSGQILRWSADGTAAWGADNNTTYSQATSSALGLVKIGYPESGKNYPVELNGSGQMYVNVPWTDNNTTYGLATTSENGLLRQLNGSTANFMRGDGTWATPPNTTYNVATTSANGLMSSEDKTKMDRVESYTTATTVASLNVGYSVIYVTLSANASLSASATGASYNGRSVTAYVYCSAARTITIPTSGSYISMCGSSYTCPAGKWVEFNLTCVNGVWHIAKLEQE